MKETSLRVSKNETEIIELLKHRQIQLTFLTMNLLSERRFLY